LQRWCHQKKGKRSDLQGFGKIQGSGRNAKPQRGKKKLLLCVESLMILKKIETECQFGLSNPINRLQGLT
jgi:hypothetical protein